MALTMAGDFILEISGTGETIMLEPIGTIDLTAARTLLAAVDTLRDGRHAALLEMRLDRVTAVTTEACEVLHGAGLPFEAGELVAT